MINNGLYQFKFSANIHKKTDSFHDFDKKEKSGEKVINNPPRMFMKCLHLSTAKPNKSFKPSCQSW